MDETNCGMSSFIEMKECQLRIVLGVVNVTATKCRLKIRIPLTVQCVLNRNIDVVIGHNVDLTTFQSDADVVLGDM